MLDALVSRTPDMVNALETLVEAESPSNNPDALRACGKVLSDIATDIVGTAPEIVEIDGFRHLHWDFGGPRRVLVLGHYDTVWPVGTLDRFPFVIEDDVARGPGAFDMKAGVVQGLFALSARDDLTGIDLLLTADEETGSASSRELVESVARRCDAVLVLEPSAGGALKTERAGVASYEIVIEGRAAHTGLDPQRGVNAIVELAHHVIAIVGLEPGDPRTTVIPTVASAGSTSNTVPGEARVGVDVRAFSDKELVWVDDALRALRPMLPGARLEVVCHSSRPPLDRRASHELFTVATRVGKTLGLPDITEATVAGGSDGNLTAAVGTPTLDGLGAVGGGAHAYDEHVVVSTMAQRAALVAGIVDEVLS